VDNAKKAHRKAADKLAAVRARTESAQQAHAAQQSATRAAHNRLEQARKATAADMQGIARLKLAMHAGAPTEPTFEQVLDTACARLAGATEEEQDELLGTILAQLLSPAAAVEQQLSDAAARAGEEARKAKADADREAHTASLRQENHEKEAATLESDQERHRRMAAAAAQELAVLPAS
jgi:hypothetical protein